MGKERLMAPQETAKWIRGLIKSNQLRKFYNSAAWLHLRSEVLEEQHRECQVCKAKGLAVEATTVHHKQHVRRRPDLALTKSNLLAVCSECHYEIHHQDQREYITQEWW